MPIAGNGLTTSCASFPDVRNEDNGKAADLPPPAPPSEDLIAIQRRAAAQLRSDRMWQRSIAHDPALAAAVKLQEEIAFLAEMLNGRWPVSRRREQFRALRILVRRFGELGARHMINLVADVSMLDLRLILRSRTDEERHDGGRERQRLEQEIEDARLLLAVHRNRADGMCNQEAIEAAASEVLGRVTLEGAKKTHDQSPAAGEGAEICQSLRSVHRRLARRLGQ